jgi:hypothetical protein
MSKIAEWHTEKTVADALRRAISKSSVCRVAVAYCGGAAHNFFPEDPADRPSDLRILVDGSPRTVKHGLTNPWGLERLLGLTPQLRSLESLHAKVSIFDARDALVGSLNLSAASVEQQYQVVLWARDAGVVRQLNSWFDGLWVLAEPLDRERIDQLKRMWPEHGAYPHRPPIGGRVKQWRGKPPDPPLVASDFNVGAPKREIKRLLDSFRSTECPYDAGSGTTCWQMARYLEENDMELSAKFHSLMRRRARWNSADLRQLFTLAHTHGRAALMAGQHSLV